MTHFYLAPESEATYRSITHSLHISHVRKKCQCGKQSTAKQLNRHGRCATCHKASTKPAPRAAGIARIVPPSAWTKARKA